MADEDPKGQADEKDQLDGIDEDAQRKLLDDPDDEEPEGADQLGDAGKRALDQIRQRAREAREARNQAIKERDDALARAKQYEDKDKSELERASGERDSWKTRAERAEQAIARRELAEELAPDHATSRQIAKVVRYMQGDSEDALRKSAEELFEDLVPAPAGETEKQRKSDRPPGKPTEKLRGGADPDNSDPGEMDPYKLADLVPRRR